jgi:hypothetical protein
MSLLGDTVATRRLGVPEEHDSGQCMLFLLWFFLPFFALLPFLAGPQLVDFQYQPVFNTLHHSCLVGTPVLVVLNVGLLRS